MRQDIADTIVTDYYNDNDDNGSKDDSDLDALMTSEILYDKTLW